jgi:threonine aldolase
MEFVDLRSDTVTKPTTAMWEAMAKADVGDDVYGEDPTINKLEKMAAEKMGKEAAIFVSSGTMGNLIAALVHCQRGNEAIMGTLAHTFLFEVAGVSALGGIMVHTVPNQADGTLLLDDIRSAIRINDQHQPVSKLVILENTANRCNGAALSAEYTQQVGKIAHENNLLLHIDGARIFNAAAVTGDSATKLCAAADSISFCLSKGLCAPVGSVLCGSSDFIYQAHRIRKQLGGGMRQAGILAAAGVVALEQMTERLVEDHRRAKVLAKGIEKISGLTLDSQPISNMVYATLKSDVKMDAKQIAAQMAATSQVKVGVVGPRRFRMVTHYWIDDAGVEKALAAYGKVL